MHKMSEGRKTHILLPDDRHLEILTQPKLLAGELLDIVSSHFNLKEKEYFGLSFKDETNHWHWLQLDRRVLEHEFPKKAGVLTLHFSVRFFINSIGFLRDNATIELFYLQSKQYIFKGQIECDSCHVFELAAHALQAANGDYVDDETTRRQLKKLPLLPTSALQEHPSISYCEDQVIAHYCKLTGQSRGSSIVSYQTLVESLPTYGIHYYEAKDKSGLPWWLGLSHKGIAQYDFNDKRVPRKVFAWKQLENLYFRDKKFSIEVHDPKRVSVSRRTFGSGGVNVHAWFGSSQSLTKCIWSMAVSQHQFYLDRKQSKSQLPPVRSMTDIAADLCKSTSSLPSISSGDISRSNSAHSLTTAHHTLNSYNTAKLLSGDELEGQTEAHADMMEALKARKEVLEDVMRAKIEELKLLCLKESELTGFLPPEIPLTPGEPIPQVKRRIGAQFNLSSKLINRDKASEVNELLTKLELEYELQGKIAKAAWKLYHDPVISKQVRKQRRASYHKAHQKLKDMEHKLNDLRLNVGKGPLLIQGSVEDLYLSEDNISFNSGDVELGSPLNSPMVNRSHLANDTIGQGQVKILTSPKVEVVEMGHLPNSPSLRRMTTPASLPTSQSCVNNPGEQNGGRTNTPSPVTQRYTPNTVYQTRTQYRNQTYPTFSMRSQSASSTQSEYDNCSSGGQRNQAHADSPGGGQRNQAHADSPGGGQRNQVHADSRESMHNLYNVSTTQTARYDSRDELKSDYEDDQYHERLRAASHAGSLDASYHKGHRGSMTRHGSLEGQLEVTTQGHHVGQLPRYTSASVEYLDYVPRMTESIGGMRIGRGQPAADCDSDSHSQQSAGSSSQDYPRPHAGSGDSAGGGMGGYGYHTPAPGPAPATPGRTHSSHHHDGMSNPSSQHWYESDSPHQSNSPATPKYEQQAPPHTAAYASPATPKYEQQAPPHTPTYATPTHTFIQQEPSPPPMSYSHESSSSSQQFMTTVTKYQSFTEVSKPFEMSDFYKYSEKLRKQRTVETRQQTLENVLAGSDPPSRASTPGYPPSYAADTARSPGPTPGSGAHSIPAAAAYQYAAPHQQFNDSFYNSTPPSPGAHQSRSRVPGHPPQRLPPAHTPPNFTSGSRPYVAPQPMSCEPARTPNATHSASARSDFDDSLQESATPAELSSFDATESQATAFSEEMLAWYEERDTTKSSTLV